MYNPRDWILLPCNVVQQKEPVLLGVSGGTNLEMGKQDRPEISCSWKAVRPTEISAIMLKGK